VRVIRPDWHQGLVMPTTLINANTNLHPVDSPMADMDALRATSASPFASQSVHSLDSAASQETGYVGLIKYVPNSGVWGGDMEALLMDFYINGICPGRTLATGSSNTYLNLLQVAETCLSTRYAILSLSASYIGEYLHLDKERYHQAELYYSTQALGALMKQISNGENLDAALATSMLLMHHDAVSSADDSRLCWSLHANVFDAIPSEFINPNSDSALFMRTQLVLARTAQDSFTLQNTAIHSLETTNWYEGTPPAEAQKICGITGLSPQLLFLISSVTRLATDTKTSENSHKAMYAQLQETQLQNLRQWTSEVGEAREVLLATGEAFRLAALIYLQCRLYGSTRFSSAVMELNDALTQVLLSIPVKGHLYTAIYPVWPLFVAAVTANSEKRDRLYQRVVPIREGDKNTLPSVLKRVSGLRIWLANQDGTQQRRDGWWDEMLLPGSSTSALPANRLLCLG